jgi:hypothetical protein
VSDFYKIFITFFMKFVSAVVACIISLCPVHRFCDHGNEHFVFIKDFLTRRSTGSSRKPLSVSCSSLCSLKWRGRGGYGRGVFAGKVLG